MAASVEYSPADKGRGIFEESRGLWRRERGRVGPGCGGVGSTGDGMGTRFGVSASDGVAWTRPQRNIPSLCISLFFLGWLVCLFFSLSV